MLIVSISIPVEHLKSQLVEGDLDKISDIYKVKIRCVCGVIAETSTRNLKRKYGDRPYLCKSCSVKAYASDPGKLSKFRESISKVTQTEAYRKKCSESAKKLWADPAVREKVSKAVEKDNKTNPKKVRAREKAKEAFMQKYGIEHFEKMMKLGHEALIRKCNQEQEFRILLAKNFHIEDPVVLDKIRRSPAFLTKEKWSDPDFRKHMAEIQMNAPTVSKVQQKLYDILNNLNMRYQEVSTIGFYTVDCILPIQGIMNKQLIIEVQGDYWHNLPATIAKDEAKSTYFNRYYPEYDLKYLWEHEFKNENRIIELLKYWVFGVSQGTTFDFKDIDENIIDRKVAELFIGKYHYASRLGSSHINLGYYVQNELIAVVAYGKPVRQETGKRLGTNNVLELNRFAISPKYQIKNLASYVISKSVKYIKKHHPTIEVLISFSDLTHNHQGIIYKASNWMLDGSIDPDYWYKDNEGFAYHKKTVWNRAKRDGLSESEYAFRTNLVKIWGKGKNRYIYKINKMQI